jgi:DNA-binding CsgD family transcriptional regulator
MNEKIFMIDDIINARECDINNYLFIDTIRFDLEITKVCSTIQQKIGMDYISFCLTLPNGTRFILSNNPGNIAIPYHIHGLSRIDNIFSPDRYIKHATGLFSPAKIPNDKMGRLFEKIHSEKFGINSVFGFARNFLGYQLITIFSQNKYSKNIDRSLPTEQELYDYAIAFFDQILPFYAYDKSQLKYSRFFQDPIFRKKLIRGELKEIAQNFKERELQCLYWTRMGKTAEEISIILGLSKATVRGYLEGIREKCDVGCIQDAIALAIEQKFIS